MVVATRRRRKLDGRQRNSFKIFTIAEDPCTVLGYLRAADVAHVAASCAGAAKLCLDDKVLERVAAERWLSAVRPAADLRGLFGLDRLEAEVSAWRVLRVKRVEITYEVVPQFEGLSAVAGGESALLYHARDAIALELVGASNGWFRWSKKGVDGATPFTGTPPTWMDTAQDWDAEWPKHYAKLEPVARPIRAGEADGALPGNWRLSVAGGALSARNGNVWIHLTDRGFRTAQSTPGSMGAKGSSYHARYEIAHGPGGGAPAEAELPKDAPGPWASAGANADDSRSFLAL